MNLEFWEGQGFAGLQDRHTKKEQRQQKQTTKRENRQTKTNKKRGEMFS